VPVCRDDRYVRVAVGFNAEDGAMIRSSHSGGEAKIETAILLEHERAEPCLRTPAPDRAKPSAEEADDLRRL
jgi:hypothetical protein